ECIYYISPRFIAMEIRIATIDDLPALVKLEKESFDNPWSEAILDGEIVREDAHIIVSRNGDISGYAIFRSGLDAAELFRIGVTKENRRRGVAESLMAEGENWCRNRGNQKLLLEVNEANTAARALYVKLGFTETGKRKGYYDSNAAILMEKNL
ncbi:MAG TPA: ribosomal protein S18-alanine N-acetyltransferase, partial [Spirochaetota bacterium]|nr:ribosomal protein S18-alanine N-acetyltransferase [Spirochaetota bacterium]